MGAIPSLGFNGLPGETSHHSSSSSSAPIAKSEIARCPPCAGLNDPPSKPVRIIQTSAWVDQGNRANRGELIRRSEENTSDLQSLMRTAYAVFCLIKKLTITI